VDISYTVIGFRHTAIDSVSDSVDGDITDSVSDSVTSQIQNQKIHAQCTTDSAGKYTLFFPTESMI
jgi:hypothetical protein